MLDTNMIIANNIQEILKRQNRKQTDLSNALRVQNHTLSKMLRGGYVFTAMELRDIANELRVSMEELVRKPATPVGTNVTHALMSRVNTDQAREAIRTADQVSDRIVYYSSIMEKYRCADIPW